MAVDMFLKIEGIDGESVDSTHGGEVDILAWSWGLSQSGTTHMGPGAGSGKVNIQDVSITKYVDASSHALMKSACKGTHIPECTLTVRKAGDSPLEYIIIKMEDVIVTSVSSGGSGGEERLTENVTLNFAKFFYKYTPQDKTGAGGAEKECNWDIAANVEL